MFRDPRYLAPLGVLLGVIVVAGVAARTGSGRSAASVAPVGDRDCRCSGGDGDSGWRSD